MSQHSPYLGELITFLTGSLALATGWSKKYTMGYIGEQTGYSRDMVYRWQQGRSCPSHDTIEILLRIGKEHANLTREWGRSLLNAVRHDDAINIVNRLWGFKEIRSIFCSLPPRDLSELIGRQAEIARLLELLSPNHAASLITVDGIGGVGKTALVLEVAYRCWGASTGETPTPTAPLFDAIIFVSAKQQYLTSDGILLSNEAKRTLRDIYRKIAAALERVEIANAAPQKQFSVLYEALNRLRTLLIVDNLETMEDKQEIMSFLYELPRSVKVIITTRERVLSFSPIRLEQLSQDESLNLIERESLEKEAELSRKQAFNLYRHIGGIPAALVYAIGQIASGYSIDTVLKRIPETGSDVARFCFESSIGPLRGQPAHHLLMAMAMFPKAPVLGALAYVAGLSDQIAVEEGLAQLRKLSLIRNQGSRYVMLPLTREYALSELSVNVPFEQNARARWVNWYLNFTQEFGGKDWTDWNIRYDRIEEEWENLLTVFEWSAAHEKYEVMQTLWQESHLVKFTHIYGYWDDRLLWLQWLIQSAEKRGDWSNAVKAMVDLSFSLTLMGQLEEADKVLERAWEKRRYADIRVQLILIQKITNLRIQQEEYANALSWLNKAKALLDITVSNLEDPERTRRLVDFLSHEGLIFYRQKDYYQAKLCYQEMLDRARVIGWQRVVIYAQNHLAYIAIAQGELDKAEVLLQTGLPVDKDKRLAAFHKHTLAYLYQKKGDMPEARRLATEAFDGFERLGMKQEAKEVDELLQQLNH